MPSTRAARAGSELKRLTPVKSGDWLKTSWVSTAEFKEIEAPRASTRDSLCVALHGDLYPSCDSAYRGRFNEPRRQPADDQLPSPASFGHRGAESRRDRRPPRPRRRGGRGIPADREEEGGAARAHPDQPLLRSLDPDPVVVRDR